jgi:hypothetical protein
MNNEHARERSIFRLHCLNRLAKLQAKLEQLDWGMSVGKELETLVHIQTVLTLMLNDLGIKCYLAEDGKVTEQLDRKSLVLHKRGRME